MLFQICSMQKGYGDTVDKFDTRLRGFLWALNGFPMNKITAAFRRYCLTKNDIPAPADIVQLIEGEGKPIMDKGTYASIKNRMKDQYTYISPREKEYVRNYENHHLSGYEL